jgi:hypothetical protein
MKKRQNCLIKNGNPTLFPTNSELTKKIVFKFYQKPNCGTPKTWEDGKGL